MCHYQFFMDDINKDVDLLNIVEIQLQNIISKVKEIKLQCSVDLTHMPEEFQRWYSVKYTDFDKMIFMMDTGLQQMDLFFTSCILSAKPCSYEYEMRNEMITLAYLKEQTEVLKKNKYK